MFTRIPKIVVMVCTVALTMLCSGTARTQPTPDEKPVMYTYVSEWAIPRAMWTDYQKLESSETDAMSKLLADGSIVAYGSFSILNHQEGAPTHGSWFSATSMANLIKVLEGVRSTPDATGPIFAASKHWDYVLQSHDYNAHSGTFKNAYLRVGFWRYKANANDPDDKVLKATMVAMLEKLLVDGALHSYQIDEQAVHSEDPGSFNVAILTNGAEGLDKFSAAIDDLRKKNPAGMAGLSSMLDETGHRDILAHVDAMGHK
jgi:hypothetical protein